MGLLNREEFLKIKKRREEKAVKLIGQKNPDLDAQIRFVGSVSDKHMDVLKAVGLDTVDVKGFLEPRMQLERFHKWRKERLKWVEKASEDDVITRIDELKKTMCNKCLQSIEKAIPSIERSACHQDYVAYCEVAILNLKLGVDESP